MNIDDLRAQIDELDERLVELLNHRAACALQIGKIKHELRIEIYQPEREAEVLRHVQACGSRMGGPLGAEAILRLFERIIDEGRRIERAMAQDGSTAGVEPTARGEEAADLRPETER